MYTILIEPSYFNRFWILFYIITWGAKAHFFLLLLKSSNVVFFLNAWWNFFLIFYLVVTFAVQYTIVFNFGISKASLKRFLCFCCEFRFVMSVLIYALKRLMFGSSLSPVERERERMRMSYYAIFVFLHLSCQFFWIILFDIL